MKKVIILLCLFFINLMLSADTVRLKDISRVYGVRSNQLMGMGLVLIQMVMVSLIKMTTVLKLLVQLKTMVALGQIQMVMVY